MTTPACPSYAGYRSPAEIISHAVWLYFRFPLSLRRVDELLAARGILVSHESVRQWALKFGQGFTNQIRRRLPAARDKWHLDEVVLTISGVKHWLWRAVDQNGMRPCGKKFSVKERPGVPACRERHGLWGRPNLLLRSGRLGRILKS